MHEKMVFLVCISNPTYVGIGTRHTQRTYDLVSGGVVGMVLKRCTEVAYYASRIAPSHTHVHLGLHLQKKRAALCSLVYKK